MTTIESKIGQKAASAEQVYRFLTDLRNLDSFIPDDKVRDWKSEQDSCSFTIPSVGSMTLRIVEKEAFKMIKIEPSGGASPFTFRFYVQIKEIAPKDSRIKLTLKADLNMVMAGVIKGPLKKGLDQIIDTLSAFQLPTMEE